MDAITLTEAQKDMLIRTYEMELEALEKKRKEIVDLLNKLKNSTPRKPSLTEGKKFTWKGISLQILKDNDDFMTTDEIYNEVLERHPDFKSHARRTLIGSLSGSLSQLASDGKLVRVPVPFGSGNYWGLDSWYKNGLPLKLYAEKLIAKEVENVVAFEERHG